MAVGLLSRNPTFAARDGKQILSQADPLYTMMRGAEVSMLPCFTRALPRPRHLQFISHHSRVHRK